ncbi:beta-1,6-N-acetylglucosaminyltransferase [Bacillus sp. DNRA2]|uniref:beta-1,6-N-acetylglucosaminyltransferase n=1 Tax=Bacillus sp. DNRA2 TaxID=2723053 RepID=UPI00145CB61D|nr:beta-1,6-N-acetylglucosaminyltransferase [Bacillus sp. DNRA2]NMD70854.1 beta-1,6-N-acetylglucosaminyltransferase [Bacillus sp. DNRA2]
MNSMPRTAYMLQIHKNPEQVNMFIHQLIATDDGDVYVHIDKKNAEQVSGKIIEHPRVKVLGTNINCEWGDISQVDTTILLLREVLASKNEYDFVALRSGQDLLVKQGFNQFLTENNDKAFFHYKKVSDENLGFMKISWPKFARKRYTTTHPVRVYRRVLLNCYKKGFNLSPNRKAWPKDYSFYKGSQWFTVPIAVAEYIIKFLDENPWYYQFFKHTLVPDESFFHTLVLNSPYQNRVVNSNLMFLKWGETLSERNSPQNLTSDDIPLIEAANEFFARKFDETIDRNVIDYFLEKVGVGLNEVESHS